MFLNMKDWYRHNHHSVLLQGACDANIFWGDVCVRIHFCTRIFLEKTILQVPVIQLSTQLAQTYIAGNFTYPL